jgi:hypothetical protein
MTKLHETVILFDPFWKIDVDIDKSIAPLIGALWKLGIETDNCCENNVPKDWIWIGFSTTRDAKKFLNLIGRYEEVPEEGGLCLYQRIYSQWDDENNWKYEIFPEDKNMGWNIDEEENCADTYCRGNPDDTTTYFRVSIRFHKSDYETVLLKLESKIDKEGESIAK